MNLDGYGINIRIDAPVEFRGVATRANVVPVVIRLIRPNHQVVSFVRAHTPVIGEIAQPTEFVVPRLELAQRYVPAGIARRLVGG